MDGREPRVLVIDDEPRLRELLAEVVPEMGYPTTVCASAEAAKRILIADPHDILILDLQLPQMSGLDLLEEVHARWPQIRVILLSAFGDVESARRAIHFDVVDFLAKPCHLREIELALDRARRKLLPTAIGPAALPGRTESDEITPLAEIEKREILRALERSDGNRTKAALALGISRRTLHYRLSRYGIS